MLIGFLLVCVVTRAECAQNLKDAGCETCTEAGPSQTCLTCSGGQKVLLDGKSCGANCPPNSVASPNVCECDQGFSLNSGKDGCVAASNTECAQNLKDAGCETCTEAGPSQTCLTCSGGQKVLLDGKSCGANCPPNSAASPNVCECDQGFSLNSGKDGCVAASNTECAQNLKDAGCETCTEAGPSQTCLTCSGGQKVLLDGKSCGANCPPNSAASPNVCECDQGFSLNSGKDGCVAASNTECAQNLKDAGCETCTEAGPSQTCLTCSGGQKVLLDGKSCGANCPPNSAASPNVCECDQGFSLNSGKDGCVAASNTECAQNLKDAGCETCTEAGPSQTCLTCSGGQKVLLDGKSCGANCPPNSAASPNVCECDQGFSLNSGKDGCVAASNTECAQNLKDAGCETCTEAGPSQTCLTCSGGQKVLLDGKSCGANCPPNSAASPNVCECDQGFSLNSGKDGCVAASNTECAQNLKDAGCETCTEAGPSQTCLTCSGGQKVLLDGKSCGANCPPNSAASPNVCECDQGFSLNSGKDGCVAASNTECAQNLKDAGCETCTEAGPSQTCLTCSGGQKVLLDGKSCGANCPPNSAASPNVCECDQGFSLNSGKDGCVAASNTECAQNLKDAGCETCTEAGPSQTCLTCSGGQKVLLDGKSCGANCPPNSAASPNVCECDQGFSLNSGKDGCVAASNTECAQNLKDAGCETCTEAGPSQTCLTCSGGQKVLLDGKSCGANCPPNSAASPNVCECDQGFSLNSGKDGCVAASNTECAQNLKDAGCETCTEAGPSQTCLTCSGGQKVLLDGKSCGANCPPNSAASPNVCECDQGFSLNSGKDGCVAASNTECAQNLKDAGCETCTEAGPSQTCLTCSGGQKVLLDGKSCGANCPPNSAASPNVCECDQGYTLNAGKTACEKASNTQCNTPNCKICDNPKTDNEICTECNDNNYLTPTKQCTQSCGAIGSYYNGDKVCEPCDSSCAACTTTGPAKCTLCPPGKRLQYTNDDPSQGGSCVDECKPQSGASGCETCGATIGGTKYCSKCSTSTEVPVNGVCTADNARAPVCSKKDNQGGCTTCASGYFLQDGGCYKTDRQPGEQICTLADSNGGCQTCANSLQPNNGACPSCHSTCKTCRDANSANTCTTCATGYYMVGLNAGPCTSCDSNSGSVKGVAGCMSCAPPSSNTGSVLCYLIKDTGSTNKSGLSTGAIAGISVAVIVVVGGLVGFLCWWFLCRGKA
ncbi:VSP [Giardia duodenalis]|uniref:VSP n=1 Tax=Giardia intestinalis (strain ATCC 50803 / WB clone C6) TaxID=184922 RepID=A0A644F8A3_GIAIC|nr:VSP [Giardia intestinalis]KAE8304911.1 VSP [Giardia intestinalis]